MAKNASDTTITKLAGKTIVAAHYSNNETTLTFTFSGGRKVTINSGLKLVISRLTEPKPRAPRLYTQDAY